MSRLKSRTTFHRAHFSVVCILATLCLALSAAPAFGAGFYPTTGWTTVKSLAEPRDLVFHGNEMFVADTIGRRIAVYSTITGSFVREFDGSDVPGGDLERPVAIALDSANSLLYILDHSQGDLRGGRVVVVTTSGTTLRSWGEWGIGDGQMRGPEDITLGPGGDVYVADTFNNRIQIFDPSGVHRRSVGETLAVPMKSPSGVAFRGNEIFVAERSLTRVKVFTSTAPATGAWSVSREWGIDYDATPTFSRYKNLQGLEWDRSGNNLFVLDSALNLVERCNIAGSAITSLVAGLKQPDGVVETTRGVFVADTFNNRIASFAPTSSGDPTASAIATNVAPLPSDIPTATEPASVARAQDGSLYVAESATGIVKKLNADGSFVATFAAPPPVGFSQPTGVAVSDTRNEVYVCDTGNNRILVYDGNGQYLTQFGSLGSEALQFSAPSAIFVDVTGYLLIADTNNNRVQVVWWNGEQWEWLYYLANGQVSAPTGIVSSGGWVYISDTGNSRIRVYSGGGSLVRDIGSYGSGDGQLFGPAGLALSASGELIVADRLNSRVQWFNTITGAPIRQFGKRGSGPGELWLPSDVEVLSAEEIAITDTKNGRIGRARLDITAPSTVATGDAGIWRSRPATIALDRTDGESGVWRTYYRIGEGPVSVYTAPFAISAEGTTAVTFWSVDYTGNTEPTRTAYALVDYTAPRGSVIFGEGGQSVFPQRQLLVTSYVSGATEMSIGASGSPGPWVPYVQSTTIDLSSEGTLTLLARYRDEAQNTTEVAFGPCVVDGTGPTTTMSRVPASGVASGPVPVTITAVDARSNVAQRWYRVDGNPNQLYSEPFEVGGWGNHSVTAWSIDQVGNVGATETISFGISQVGQGGNLTLQGGDDYIGPDVLNVDRFTLSAITDIQGATGMGYDAGFGLVQQPFVASFWPTFPAVEGTHTLFVEFQDAVTGATHTLSDSFRYDVTDPVTTLHGAQEGIAYPRSVVVSFTTEDDSPINATRYWINGEGPYLYSEPFTLAEDADYTIDYASTDEAGNDEAPQTVTFTVAAVPPSGTVGVSDGLRYVNHTEVVIESTMTRALMMRYDTGSGFGPFEPYAPTKTLELPAEGDYRIVASFINTAGVETTVVVPVQVDLSVPVTSVHGVSEGVAYSRALEVSLTVADASPTRVTEYWINGDGPFGYSGPVPIEYEGMFQIDYRSTDEAGNVEDTRTISFEVAVIPPSGVLRTAGGVRYINFTDITLESTMTRALQMRFDYGTGYSEFEPYAKTKTISLPGEGAYDVVGSFVNTAGVEATIAVPVQVDFTAPESVPNGVEEGVPYPGAVEITFTVNDASPLGSIECWVDGAAKEFDGSLRVEGEGVHTVGYRAIDAAGNAETTRSISFEIATTPPSGTLRLLGPSLVNTTTVSVESSMIKALQMRFDVGTGFGSFEPYVKTKSVVLPGEGVFNIVGSYVNTAGVEATLAVPVTVDLTRPTVTTLTILPKSFRLYSGVPRYEVILSSTATDTGTVRSGVTAWRWRIGSEIRSTARSARYPAVRRGKFALYGAALDKAGNRGSQVGGFWSGASSAMRVPTSVRRYRSFGVSGSVPLAGSGSAHRILCYKKYSSGAWVLKKTISTSVSISGTSARMSKRISMPPGTWKLVFESRAGNSRVYSSPSATISVR